MAGKKVIEIQTNIDTSQAVQGLSALAKVGVSTIKAVSAVGDEIINKLGQSFNALSGVIAQLNSDLGTTDKMLDQMVAKISSVGAKASSVNFSTNLLPSINDVNVSLTDLDDSLDIILDKLQKIGDSLAKVTKAAAAANVPLTSAPAAPGKPTPTATSAQSTQQTAQFAQQTAQASLSLQELARIIEVHLKAMDSMIAKGGKVSLALQEDYESIRQVAEATFAEINDAIAGTSTVTADQLIPEVAEIHKAFESFFTSSGRSARVFDNEVNEIYNDIATLLKSINVSSMAAKFKAVGTAVRSSLEAGNLEEAKIQVLGFEPLLSDLSEKLDALRNAQKNAVSPEMQIQLEKTIQSLERLYNEYSFNYLPLLNQVVKKQLPVAAAADKLNISTTKLGQAINWAAQQGQDFDIVFGKVYLTEEKAREVWDSYQKSLRSETLSTFNNILSGLVLRMSTATQEAKDFVVTMQSLTNAFDKADVETVGMLGGLKEMVNTLAVLHQSTRELLQASGESASSLNVISSLTTVLGTNLQNLQASAMQGLINPKSILLSIEQVERMSSMIDKMIAKVKEPSTTGKELVTALTESKNQLDTIDKGLADILVKTTKLRQAQIDMVMTATKTQISDILAGGRGNLKDMLLQFSAYRKEGVGMWETLRRVFGGSSEATNVFTKSIDNLLLKFKEWNAARKPLTAESNKQIDLLKREAVQYDILGKSLVDYFEGNEQIAASMKDVNSYMGAYIGAINSMHRNIMLGKDAHTSLATAMEAVENMIITLQENLTSFGGTLTADQTKVIQGAIESYKVLQRELQHTSVIYNASRGEQVKQVNVFSQLTYAIGKYAKTVKEGVNVGASFVSFMKTLYTSSVDVGNNVGTIISAFNSLGISIDTFSKTKDNFKNIFNDIGNTLKSLGSVVLATVKQVYTFGEAVYATAKAPYLLVGNLVSLGKSLVNLVSGHKKGSDAVNKNAVAFRALTMPVKAAGEAIKLSTKSIGVMVNSLGGLHQHISKVTNTFRHVFLPVFLGTFAGQNVGFIFRNTIMKFVNAMSTANDAFANFRASLTGIISGRGGFADATARIKAINEESAAWFEWAKGVIAKSSFELVDVLQTIPQMMKYGFNPQEWLYPMIEMAASFNTNVNEVNEAVFRMRNNVTSWRQSFRAIGIPIESVTAYVKRNADGTMRAAKYAEIYDEATGDLRANLRELGYEEVKLLNANNELNYSTRDSTEILRAWSMQSSMVVGQAEEQAKTWKGVLSNIHDTISLLLVDLGSPIFDALARVGTDFLEKINKYMPVMEQTLRRLGAGIAAVISKTYEWFNITGSVSRTFVSAWEGLKAIIDKDGKAVITSISDFARSAVMVVSDAIRGFARLIDIMFSRDTEQISNVKSSLAGAMTSGMRHYVDKNEMKMVGRQMAESTAQGIKENSNVVSSAVKTEFIDKAFEEVSGANLSKVTQAYTSIGSESLNMLNQVVDLVTRNVTNKGEEIVSESLRFKTRILQALSVSGSASDLTQIANEYAQKFIGSVASVNEFIQQAMSAVVANYKVNEIQQRIKEAEKARDAAIKIIDSEIEQIRSTVSGLERRESDIDKRLEAINKEIAEKVTKRLRDMGISIDDTLLQRLQTELDLLQSEYNQGQDRLEMLRSERERLGIKVMSQEEIKLMENQKAIEQNIKRIQEQIAQEERNQKVRELMTLDIQEQYRKEKDALTAEKESIVARIETLQSQLETREAEKEAMEKKFEAERANEQKQLDALMAVADQLNTSVSVLSELFGNLNKATQDAEETMVDVYNKAPELAEAMSLDDLVASVETSIQDARAKFLESTGSALTSLGNAIVDLITSVTNAIIGLFGQERIEVSRYKVNYLGQTVEERRPIERLEELAKRLSEQLGLGDKSIFTLVVDLLRKMDDLIIAISSLVASMGHAPGVESVKGAVTYGAGMGELGLGTNIFDYLFTTLWTQLSNAIFGGETTEALFAKNLMFRGAKFSEEQQKEIEETWSQTIPGKVEGAATSVVDAVVGVFNGLYNTIVGHSIVPDMLLEVRDKFIGFIPTITDISSRVTNPVISAFENLEQNVLLSIDNIIGAYSSLADNLQNMTPNINMTYANNIPAFAGLGAANFVFSPVITVSGEVDRAIIGKLLTEQRKEFMTDMKNYFRQEVRR